MKLREQLPQPSDQSYRLIPLTQGQVAIVDAEDFEYLSQWNWCAMWSPCVRSFYAIRGVYENGKVRQVYMARVIMNAPQGVEVDHIGHSTLDNRREYLRVATRQQNSCNKRQRTDSTSGFKGVTWSKLHRKWIAQIQTDKKKQFLGLFPTAELAFEAYKTAAAEVHGEFSHF